MNSIDLLVVALLLVLRILVFVFVLLVLHRLLLFLVGHYIPVRTLTSLMDYS
jgi:hypothetical protein